MRKKREKRKTVNGCVKRSIKPTQSSGHGGRHIWKMFSV